MPPELMGLGTLPLENTTCRALDSVLTAASPAKPFRRCPCRPHSPHTPPTLPHSQRPCFTPSSSSSFSSIPLWLPWLPPKDRPVGRHLSAAFPNTSTLLPACPSSLLPLPAPPWEPRQPPPPLGVWTLGPLRKPWNHANHPHTDPSTEPHVSHHCQDLQPALSILRVSKRPPCLLQGGHEPPSPLVWWAVSLHLCGPSSSSCL